MVGINQNGVYLEITSGDNSRVLLGKGLVTEEGSTMNEIF